jgi:hypothetical protein
MQPQPTEKTPFRVHFADASHYDVDATNAHAARAAAQAVHADQRITKVKVLKGE